MKRHLLRFDTHADYENYMNSGDVTYPNVAYCVAENHLHYNKEEENEYSKQYLTLEIISGGSLFWKVEKTDDEILSDISRTIEYSKNDGVWQEIRSTVDGFEIECESGDKIRFRGNNNTYGICVSKQTAYPNTIVQRWYVNYFGNSENLKCKLCGNIMSLIDENEFANLTYFPESLEQTSGISNCIFYRLFQECSSIVEANNLILPVINLLPYCYGEMFLGCENMTVAPKLTSTNLSDFCYYRIFCGCHSLTNAPELPSLEVKAHSYHAMFMDCISIVTAPKLPAKIIGDSCYAEMFALCSNLVNAPELPATVLKNNCYSNMFGQCVSLKRAPKMSANVLSFACYSSMFWGCTNLVEAPELPSTILYPSCYNSMFHSCTSLTVAPSLPATVLQEGVYWNMFYGCSNLKYVNCMAKNINAENCLTGWLNGVSQSGTFVKHPSMNKWVIGVNGIPEGWTIEDAIID